jgi:tetratricopeptide (TPR) repeat protein
VRELFLQARELDADGRRELLRPRGDADDALRTAAAALLTRDAAGDGALDRPALGADFVLPEPQALREQALPPGLSDRFGSFRLLGVLGAGGMGIVYRARQQAPPRDVALKVLQPARADAEHLARFRFEVEALGRLQHPGIAAIFDAGTVDHGAGPQPFLAMELIQGRPLLEHATRARLELPARLRLLAAIADAMQHAHQRGIVHRDLKPANVLVDDSGQPKVLDFGIATAIDRTSGPTTRQRDPLPLGTLPYMSPEQLRGRGVEVDLRSDVYALGVLLHELLTGQLPFDLRGMDARSAAEHIATAAPRPLAATDRRLRGDLEAIAGRALAVDPAQRYAGAGEFAADLRAWLRHEPVAARPAGPVRAAWLFCRRHRALVVGAASTVLALALGWYGTSRALDTARNAQTLAEERRALAEHNADRAAAVRGFLLELFGRMDPQLPEADPGVDRLLATAVRELGPRFADHPDLEAELRVTLGSMLRLFGRLDAAREQLDLGVQLRASTFGNEAGPTLLARAERLKLDFELGEWQRPIEQLGAMIESAAVAFGPRDAQTLRLRQLEVRALKLTDRFAAALQRLEPLLEDIAAAPAVPTELPLLCRLERGDCLFALDQPDAARRELEACVAEARQRLGPRDPLTIHAMGQLGSLLLARRDLDAAEPLLLEVHANRRARLPDRHPALLQIVHNLGALAALRGRHDEGLALLTAASDGRAEALGPRHSARIGSLVSRANLLSRIGRTEAADAAFTELLQLLAEDSGDRPWLQAHAQACSGLHQARCGRRELARQTITAAIARMRELAGEQHPRTLRLVPMLTEAEQLADAAEHR